jgi:hypothetical protein
VVVTRQTLARRPSRKLDHMLGLSKDMINAVLNGRRDESIDLAKTHLF